jgi:D-alanine-D-alanine ligase
MKIGLTYDLRDDYLAEGFGEEETAEFDRCDTIDALAGALQQLGHRPDRIGHARHLVARLARGDRWDLVFNIAEGLHGVGREAQVPAILDLYQVPYTFSDPLVSALTLHKAMAKRVVRDAGIPTPDFAVVETSGEAAAVRLPLPLFVKPLAEGTGKGVSPTSIVRRREDLGPVCEDLLRRFRQPVLVETLLPGREFTVGIWGTNCEAEAIGTLEVVLLPGSEESVYSYVNKEHCEVLVDYRLVDAGRDEAVAEAERLALAAWRVLGCRDAGRVDLRSDDSGRPHFLEVNPLAGLHPEHSDLPILCNQLNIPYLELIDRIVRSATARIARPASFLEVTSLARGAAARPGWA